MYVNDLIVSQVKFATYLCIFAQLAYSHNYDASVAYMDRRYFLGTSAFTAVQCALALLVWLRL